MAAVLSFGIALVIAIQALGPWLTGPMKFCSFVGSEEFVTFFVPLVYWSINEALGLRLAFILLGSTGLNELVKIPLHGPRPYWLSTAVKPMASETGFGVPSGHSQISAAFWGLFAARIGKVWVWTAVLMLVALIGLSRLYLGVHFPHDVLVGWTLAFLTVWVFQKFWSPIAARVKQMSMGAQIGLALAVSLAMLAIGEFLAFLSRDWVMPALWIVNATRNGGAAPAPLALSRLIPAAGTLLGQCVGLAVMAPRGGFSAAGSTGQRALRFVVGLLGVVLIAFGLKAVLPSDQTPLATALRYVRYVILGFWVTGGAIWIFSKLHLTGQTDAT